MNFNNIKRKEVTEATLNIDKITTIQPNLSSKNPAFNSSNNLQMTPENCSKVNNYSKMFGVPDPQQWIRNNCVFVQTFMPVSCNDLNAFVDSCFVNKNH